MRLVTILVVAAVVLWAVDATLNDGRYTDVVVLAFRHLAASAGFHI